MLTVQAAVLYPVGMARMLRHLGSDCAVQAMMSGREMQFRLAKVSCVSRSMPQARAEAARQ